MRRYLARRWCWPPEIALPDCVHWLSVPAAEIASRRLPALACGVLVFGFDVDAQADAQALAAVQLEALAADGQRLTAWPSSSSTQTGPAAGRTCGRTSHPAAAGGRGRFQRAAARPRRPSRQAHISLCPGGDADVCTVSRRRLHVGTDSEGNPQSLVAEIHAHRQVELETFKALSRPVPSYYGPGMWPVERGRIQSLVGGGMELADAARVSGVLMEN